MDHITVRDQMRTVLTRDIAPQFVGTAIHVQRAMLDAMGAQAEVPTGVAISQKTLAEVPVEWLSPVRREQRVILYLHGGGFAMGSSDAYRAFVARLAIACQAQLVFPEYRLAPERPFPAGLHDTADVYAGLLEQGYEPEQIIVAGDSAGGGLALSTLIEAKLRGLPMPQALVLMSPWTDLTFSGESIETRAAIDPWLRPESLSEMRELYLRGTDPANPLASPLWADLSALPPMLIQVGEQEILLSDSLRLATRARAAGVSVELELGKDLWHVWQFFGPALPDANEAIDRIGAFVDAQFETNSALRHCG